MQHKIHRLLMQHNLENNIDFSKFSGLSNAKKNKELVESLTKFLNNLGFNLESADLHNTKIKVIELMLNTTYSGLDYKNFPEINLEDNISKYNSPVMCSGIAANSTCEHHLVPFSGNAVFAYIPKKHIIGLGKITKIINFFARRPQIQERLNKQIFVVMQHILNTDDIAIGINASHQCMSRLGETSGNSNVTTFELGGKFKSDNNLANTFYSLINNFNQNKS
jgi:GTP cyclohydrolase I